MYILDSDVLNFYLHKPDTYPHLCRQIDDADAKALICLPVITVEETLIGVINELRKDYIQRSDRIVEANAFLYQLINDLKRFIVLPFDDAAYLAFQGIPKKIRESAPNDCRIAAIALSRGDTVVTNNGKDFLRIEDATSVKVAYWVNAS